MMKQKFWAGGATSNIALYGIKGPFMPKYGKFCFGLQWTPYMQGYLMKVIDNWNKLSKFAKWPFIYVIYSTFVAN